MKKKLESWAALCVLTLSMTCIAYAVEPFTGGGEARAQAMCTEYKELQQALLDKFQEQPNSVGLTQKGDAAYTVFTSPDGGSWTIAVVSPTGKACVIAAGKTWTDISKPAGEPS